MEARTYPDTATVHARGRNEHHVRPALPARQPRLHVAASASGYVVACEGDTYRIDNGRRARAALSCVIKPEAGDLVQLFHAEEQCFITAILRRAAFEQNTQAGRTLEMSVGGADTLLLTVPNLRCVSTDSIALVAGQACEIASPQGRVTLTARNLFTIATDNLIQQARTSLTQAVNYSVKALDFLHLKGHRQLISAETEIRLDGQYINMG
jgi:hypothetical protein